MPAAILLTTYNGEAHLPAQLASIAAQTQHDWKLYASDDGSQDGTLALLQQFAVHHPVEILPGPRQGFVRNFMSLVENPMIDADAIAFADQDDVWHPDKLARAMAALANHPATVPVLYGSRTRYIDEAGKPLGESVRFTRPVGFANALVQCFAGGNTMVMNRAAHRLLQQASAPNIVSHDWWAYQLISGAGGVVMYDPEPTLDYRQHAGNLAGSNRGLARSTARAKTMLQGGFRGWNDRQCAALQANRPLLSDTNRQRLDTYCAARQDSLWPRLRGLLASGIYRQTWAGNAGLVAAALLKRI